MRLEGARVHISGSAAVECSHDLLERAQQYIADISARIVESGAGIVTGAGTEPLGDSGLPLTFDWTALESAARVADSAHDWPATETGRITVVASQAALEQIPEGRRQLWNDLHRRPDFALATPPAGWRMGGAIREEQVRHGDALLVLGGGAGVEHLAEMYMDDGKPVIALRAEVGSISNDGKGGGSYLHAKALADSTPFLTLREGAGNAAARLNMLTLDETSDVLQLADETLALLRDIAPARAFYVRLLAPGHPESAAVESFFREVVDPVVAALGYRAHEVGRAEPLAAFLNVEIFEGLHRAGLVFVDLTGVRPNCLMELGYALGRRRPVIVTARRGTEPPFDSDKLPIFFWDDAGSETAEALAAWCERVRAMPPLVGLRR
jgi:hypothetical protein